MTTIHLDWVGVADNPNIFPPAGFTSLGAATANVAANVWSGNSSSANTVWGYDIPVPADSFTVSIKVATINSNGRGISIHNASGNGLMFLVRNSDIRVFALAAYVLSGSALATYTLSIASESDIDIDVTQSTGTYAVKYNGATVNTFVNTTYTSGLRAGPLSRSGAIRSFDLTYADAQSITAPPDPIIPGETKQWGATGFSNGAATLSFAGVSIPVTLADNAFNAAIPMLADNTGWPRLPSASTSFTLTQGATTASVNAPISLPTGYDVVRDGSNNPANFAGLIGDNDKYLQYWFAAAGNPLTTGDTAYHVTSGNYLVGQDSGVGADTASLPRTDKIFIHRASGFVYEHDVELNSAGDIVSVGGITAVGLTMSGITMRGITAVGL